MSFFSRLVGENVGDGDSLAAHGPTLSNGELKNKEEEFDFTTASGDRIILTYDDLDEKQALSFVRDDGAGATCLFVGTTRNEFQGKTVDRLQYMAYTALARKMMSRVVEKIRGNGTALSNASSTKNSEQAASTADTATRDLDPLKGHGTSTALVPETTRVYLAHRLGDVSVAEPSILVCVSSAHRKAAFEACSAILEEVKRQVPIWKKEVYGGEYSGTSEWKANAA